MQIEFVNLKPDTSSSLRILFIMVYVEQDFLEMMNGDTGGSVCYIVRSSDPYNTTGPAGS